MTLEAPIAALLDELVYVERRPGDDDPGQRVTDEYGNVSEVWRPVPNPEPCGDDADAWVAAVEPRRVGSGEDVTDRNVGSIEYLVVLEPDNPIRRTDRIRRLLDDTLLHPIFVHRYSGGGGSHLEVRATEVS